MNYFERVTKAVESNACDDYIRLMETVKDVSKKNTLGWTVVHLAAIQGHLEMIELVMGQGAKINNVDNNGWSPLMFAVICQNNDIVKFLLEKGADPNIKNKLGMTALDLAETVRNSRSQQTLQAYSSGRQIKYQPLKFLQARYELFHGQGKIQCDRNTVITRKTWVYLLCEWFKTHSLTT